MISNFLFIIISSVVINNCDGVCLNYEGLGNVISALTDPLCNAWCEIKLCGPGKCMEDPKSTTPIRCVCEKCYIDKNGRAVYPGESTDNQQAPMNSEQQLDRLSDRQLQQQSRMNNAWHRGGQ
ncbi:uncharacterized protein CELE_Y38H6C.23 [Caenorhabditis elegans]|uniref:Uncharacterized protein n=1 Tax=Caenorhabditis elegans TaxID=6239 RepID=Q7YWQ9_CAEEL|nr:Uncharacterized protein CELE_Y38H6C.23 [Caenorhabditis elegans]CAE17995.1 Uncharacterized protein CELE_Y38H6C.23 [Caenorhabditis elegans]|eukprot:NP_001024226.1 Uncharacterized protein CELE_Y38H6C.23 [Caenorhabditis elegans]